MTRFNEAAVIRLRKFTTRAHRASAQACFNEAAVIRLRKSPRSSGSGREPRGFNEAAVIRLRKYAGARGCRTERHDASMRPQSSDCGNVHDLLQVFREPFGFNEAAVIRLRKSTEGAEKAEADAGLQ